MLNEVVRKNKIAELLRLYKQVERKDFLVILKEMAAKKEIDSYVVKEVLDSLQTGVSENNEETGDIDNLAGQFYNLLKKVKNTEIKGDKGDDGEDGYTPQKGKDYFTNQEITEFKMSVTPIKGEDYFDGEDGYTPEKGKDYFTEKEIKEFKNAVTPIKGEDYFDGKDADEERVVEKVLKKIPKVDIKDIGGKEIVDKVNALEIKPELQIDAKHIKNLPSSQSPFMLPGGGGMSEVSHDTTLTGTGTSSDPLSVAISGLGLVDSVVAGTNIEVDNTDPANPVVSAPDVEPALGNPTVSGYILSSTDTGARSWIAPAAGGGDVDSVFGRNGDVVAAQDDYTFEQIDKTNANIADIPLRSHIDLQDIGVNAHTDIDNHLADSTIHFTPLTEGSVPFVAPGGAMTEANPGLVFDPSVNQLRIGVNALPILDGDAKAPLVIGGADAQWVQLYVQNTATSPYGMSLVSAINDISGAGISEVIGNMMGCGSSVIAHPAFPFLKPNDSFLCAFGGDQLIGAIYPTKKVLFFTGGGADDNIRLQIEEDKTSIIANKEDEIVPALEAANWTATNGYSAGSGVITLVNDIDDSTIQPNPALTITAGNTYEVQIVCSAHSGTVGYTLGGVSGSAIVEGTIDEYITATTTGNFIMTGTAGATCTVTSISIRELVANTGNLFVEGDIVLGSKLSTTTGAGILAANGEGVATFDSIPLLPAANPTLDNEAVRKGYVDTVVQGLYPTFNCRLATTVAGTLATSFEAGDTIDTKTLVEGDIILIKNQVDQKQNGFYEVQASGAPVRVAPFETGDTMARGTYTSIEDGSTNLQTSWVMYLDDATIDTDNILFRQNYVSQPPYTGSDGIDITAFNVTVDLADTNPSLEIADGGLRAKTDDLSITKTASGLKVKVDDSSIEIDGTNGLQVKALGVTNSMLAGSIADSKLDTISTAGKVSGAALTSLANIPSAAGVIPIANLATGTPDGTKFVRDDGTLAVPPGAGATGVVEAVVAGDNVSVDSTDPANPVVSSTGGVAHITISGTINDSNTTFTALSEPLDLVINGATYAKTGGAITWTYTSGTIELSSPVGTGGSIYGIYSGNVVSNAVIYVGATEPAVKTVNMIWFS